MDFFEHFPAWLIDCGFFGEFHRLVDCFTSTISSTVLRLIFRSDSSLRTNRRRFGHVTTTWPSRRAATSTFRCASPRSLADILRTNWNSPLKAACTRTFSSTWSVKASPDRLTLKPSHTHHFSFLKKQCLFLLRSSISFRPSHFFCSSLPLPFPHDTYSVQCVFLQLSIRETLSRLIKNLKSQPTVFETEERSPTKKPEMYLIYSSLIDWLMEIFSIYPLSIDWLIDGDIFLFIFHWLLDWLTEIFFCLFFIAWLIDWDIFLFIFHWLIDCLKYFLFIFHRLIDWLTEIFFYLLFIEFHRRFRHHKAPNWFRCWGFSIGKNRRAVSVARPSSSPLPPLRWPLEVLTWFSACHTVPGTIILATREVASRETVLSGRRNRRGNFPRSPGDAGSRRSDGSPFPGRIPLGGQIEDRLPPVRKRRQFKYVWSMGE